jgi:hypothetical protein
MGRARKPQAMRQRCRIVVHGEFGDLLQAAFADASVTTGGGKTVLVTTLRDSQELYGVLDRLRDYGVKIETVSQVDVLD